MADYTREEIEKVVKASRKIRGANLVGIDLSRAYLTDAYLTGAKYSVDTKWPEGFDPEAAGAEMVE